MCNAYTEIGLFVLMCLGFSRCRIPIDLPVWPTYELLQVLHFNVYVPLEFTLFSGILARSWLYVVLLVRKAIFKLVFLHKLVTFCMSGLLYILTTPALRQHQRSVKSTIHYNSTPMFIYDIFVNCKWVATRWQLYNTLLHTNSTLNDKNKQYIEQHKNKKYNYNTKYFINP